MDFISKLSDLLFQDIMDLKGQLGVELARRLLGQAPADFSPETAIGALALYVSNESVTDFQPMNINFGIMPPSLLHPVVSVQKAGGLQIGIPVHDPVAQKLRLAEGGDHGEDPLLLGPFQVPSPRRSIWLSGRLSVPPRRRRSTALRISRSSRAPPPPPYAHRRRK